MKFHCRQFKILLWRCYLIKKRQPILTTVEIVLPIFMAAFIAIINHYDTQGNRGIYKLVPEERYKPTVIFPTFDNIEDERREGSTVYFTPFTNLTANLMNIAKTLAGDRFIVATVGVKDESNFTEILKTASGDSSGFTDVIGGVKFHVDINMRNPPADFKYTLYMTKFDQVNAIFPKKISSKPFYKDDMQNAYFSSYFIHLQCLVNEAYLDMIGNGNRSIRPVIAINKYPYPQYIDSPHIYSLKTFISRSNVIGFIAIIPIVLKVICGEKERRIKQMMKLMGMNDFYYYGSIFLSHFIIALFDSFVITCLYFLSYSGKPLLQHASITLVFFTLVLFTFALLLFVLALSTFFNKPVSATVFTLILYISSFELPHNLMKKPGLTQSEGFQVPEAAHLWTCLLPTVGMDWCFTIIVEMEVYLVGAHWNNLLNEVPSFEKMKLGKVYLVMLYSCVAMFIMILYLDAAWPWQHGVTQPLYFPFLVSYWCGNTRRPSSTHVAPRPIDKSFFEPEPPGKPVICAENLSKKFGIPFFTKMAVKDVTLNVYSGQITVLLGHNGAGKTTTMSMLTGIIPPTSGAITIDGYDLVTQTNEARRKVGLCPQHNVLYDELTVEEHLILYGVLKAIDEITLEKEIKTVVKKLDLTPKIHSPSNQLSGGMKRKLSLAIAMIGHPKVLILDEPTAGMDPEARRSVWDLLLGVRREMAVLVTTHHMEEADVLGDRIAIMADGVVKCAGTSMFLKNKFGAGYHLVFAKTEKFSFDEFKRLITAKLPEALIGNETNTEIVLTVDPKHTMKLGTFFEVFEDAKKAIGVSSCGVTVTTMEDVFLQVGSTFKNLKGFSTPNINDYAVFIKKPRRANVAKKPPEPKAFGFELFIQRFFGLILKRYHFAKRYLPTLINQLLVPALVVLILCELQRQMLNSLDIPAFSLDLELKDLYKETSAFVYKSQDFSSSALHKVATDEFVKELEEEGVDVTEIKTDPNDYLLEIAKRSVNLYQKRHIISASFEEKMNESTITAWYNGEALHSLPISLNMIYRALQQEIISNRLQIDKGNISVGNVPFPKRAFYKQWFTFPKLGQYLYLSFIPLSMAFIASAFILIPIHERVSKSKLVQLMTGINRFLFWFSHFLFDFATHLIACLLILLIFWFWDTSDIYFSSFEYTFGLFLIFVVFGFAMIPIVYLFSMIIDSQPTGFAAIMMISLMFGLILGYIVYVFELLVDKGTISQGNFNVVYGFSVLFPPFALSWAVRKMFFNGASTLLCDKIPSIQKDAMCQLFEPEVLKQMHLIGCCKNLCDDVCYDRKVCFHWQKYGINTEIIALLAVGVIFASILLMVESNFFPWLRSIIENSKFGEQLCVVLSSDFEVRRLKSRSKSKSTEIDDDDVIKEQEKVDRLVKEHKIASEAMIVQDLTKKFGHLTAVDNLSLSIHKEEFFGFLGINGAGKTTTFSMLTGDLKPTNGNAYINDTDCNLVEHPKLYCQQIGYCPQFDPLLDKLTGREMLMLIARLRGIKASSVVNETDNLLKLVDLEIYADSQTVNYSGGNKRKLSLAMAIVGSPKVVFLDEPTAGVDAESRRKMWTTLIDLQAMTGCSIVLTSHTIDECEALCNRLTIMVNGKFRCLGSTQHLRSKFGQGFTIVIKMKRDVTQAIKVSKKETAVNTKYVKDYMMKAFPTAVLKDEHDVLIHFHVPDRSLSWAYLFKTMEKAKKSLKLEDYQIGDTTLEQIFLAFARKQRKDDKR